MPALLRIILLFFIFLLSLRNAQVCIHYLDYIVFTPVLNIGLLCKYIIECISILDS
jgi:hypothetical protein